MALIVLGAAGYFLAHPTEMKEADDSYKIGVVLGLTGPESIWSDYARKAADLAVEEVNNAGGINGHPVELVYEDSKSDPAGSVSAFQKLINVDHVSVVIGDVWAFTTNPLIPIADRSKVVLVSPTVMDTSVEGSSPYFYTLGHTIDSQRAAVELFFQKNPEIKTASIVCWNDTWGQSNIALFKEVASEHGVSIVSEDCTGDFAENYRTIIAKVKVKRPDAILATVSSPVIAPFMKAVSEFGIESKILTTNVVVEGTTVWHIPASQLSTTWFTDWVPDEVFLKAFKSKYGVYPIMESQNAYEAVRSVAQALKNNDRDTLDGLRSVHYASVDGSIDFSGDHNIVNKAEAKLYSVDPSGAFIEVK